MKDVPTDKLFFYSEQHQSLRALRKQLEIAVGHSTVNCGSLSRLEVEIVKEAFQTIAERGNEVLVTFDQDVYARDLEKMKAGDHKVYLLCNKEGSLQDLNPLLPFVSAKRKIEYGALRDKYLRSE